MKAVSLCMWWFFFSLSLSRSLFLIKSCVFKNVSNFYTGQQLKDIDEAYSLFSCRLNGHHVTIFVSFNLGKKVDVTQLKCEKLATEKAIWIAIIASTLLLFCLSLSVCVDMCLSVAICIWMPGNWCAVSRFDWTGWKLNVKNALGENSHKTRIKSQVSLSCNFVLSTDTYFRECER